MKDDRIAIDWMTMAKQWQNIPTGNERDDHP
jgi:hypothetical protein